MRPLHALTTGLMAAALLAGCSHSVMPTAALVTTPVAAPTAEIAPVEAPSVTVVSDGALKEVSGDDVPKAVRDAMKVQGDTLPQAGVRAETGTSTAANILDPWRPYAVGVTQATHDSVTLTWRTDANSRAIVYFAKTFGFSWTGYTQVYPENTNATFHTVTIPGLSRFRKYRFFVVGLAPLGMQFPSYPLDFRTRLF